MISATVLAAARVKPTTQPNLFFNYFNLLAASFSGLRFRLQGMVLARLARPPRLEKYVRIVIASLSNVTNGNAALSLVFSWLAVGR